MVLDAGCGTGRHLRDALGRDGIRVVGVDLNGNDLRQTHESLSRLPTETGRGSGQNARWLVARADVTCLPFRDASFDVVVCSEVLEHIADNRLAAAELSRVLKPGMHMVVSVPRFLPNGSAGPCPGPITRSREGTSGFTGSASSVTCWRIRAQHAGGSGTGMRCTRRIGGFAAWSAIKTKNFRSSDSTGDFWSRDILSGPPLTRFLEKLLNPLMAKSIVYYLRKG